MSTGSVEMIFEIGFNYCCRNYLSNSSFSVENLNLKLSANLLNEITNITEHCLIEFSGEWARTMSFVEPNMDMKIVGELPDSNNSSNWSDCVIIQNLSGPEPIETRYVISKVTVVETNPEGSTKLNRLIEFGKNRDVTNCRVVGGRPVASNMGVFPNYWRSRTRMYVDKTLGAYRPLTTITADVPVINVIVAFLANSPPGPYKFDHPTDPYVRTNIHVCDLSYRNLKLSAIRTGGDDFREVPAFHLHVQIDLDVETAALPWFCVGDVLQVHTVKPMFVQKQAWNLMHKQKRFGDTKVNVFSIEDGSVRDVQGAPVAGVTEPPQVAELRAWMKDRLSKDSIVGGTHEGKLANRDMWMNGRDSVARVERVNRYSNSVYVTDFSCEDLVEVKIRSSQQKFAESLNYLFTKLEEEEQRSGEGGVYVLMRNLRCNTTDKTLYCSVEHVTKVPVFCFDVQELIRRKERLEAGASQEEVKTQTATQDSVPPATLNGPSFGFDQMIPTQWKESFNLGDKRPVACTQSAESGCVDSSSQVTFEFVDDDEADAGEDRENVASQATDNLSQVIPTKLAFDTQISNKKARSG